MKLQQVSPEVCILTAKEIATYKIMRRFIYEKKKSALNYL